MHSANHESDSGALVDAYLATLPAEQLRARLRAAADVFDPLYLRLLTEAQAAAGVLDIAALKKDLTAMLRVASRHERWRGAARYADEARGAIDVVGAVLDAGRAEDAVGLSEHVIKRLDTALGRLDDSEGALEEPMMAIADLHHRACVAARPDARKLATRMLDLTLKSDWAWFADAPEAYAEVLGPQGLAVYRSRLERAAARPASPTGSGDRSRIQQLRESLARATGSLDELVAVMSAELRSAYGYHRIANVLDDAGRTREALTWLERGVARFGPNADPRLRQALLDAYLRDGLEHDAVELAVRAFDDAPTADTYGVLRRTAAAVGTWAIHRTAALQRLRTRPGGWDRSDRSEAVLAQLDEGELDAAWADAYEGGCRSDVWQRLADASRSTRPDDAVAVYRRQVDALLDGGTAYANVVRVLRTWHATLAEAGRADELASDLARLRAAHSRKRTFLRLLDEERFDLA